LVGRDKHSNLPQLLQVKGHGQLQRIERPQSFRDPVSNEEFPGALEVALMKRGSDKDALPRKVSPETSAGDFQGPLIDLSGSRLDGEHGLQLHNRKVRDQ
jgi:hypothetical protein